MLTSDEVNHSDVRVAAPVVFSFGVGLMVPTVYAQSHLHSGLGCRSHHYS